MFGHCGEHGIIVSCDSLGIRDVLDPLVVDYTPRAAMRLGVIAMAHGVLITSRHPRVPPSHSRDAKSGCCETDGREYGCGCGLRHGGPHLVDKTHDEPLFEIP
ncbi:hypothetical protein HAX54_027671 [Datura stramonium]|uniref:Uncharacterized protein n=1 Tax=Datura stramonium TaxID=4076 RepID=A0ABS8V627_DATST|nr:hypothetical protein [Datura stramonium]